MVRASDCFSYKKSAHQAHISLYGQKYFTSYLPECSFFTTPTNLPTLTLSINTESYNRSHKTIQAARGRSPNQWSATPRKKWPKQEQFRIWWFPYQTVCGYNLPPVWQMAETLSSLPLLPSPLLFSSVHSCHRSLLLQIHQNIQRSTAESLYPAFLLIRPLLSVLF